MNDINNDDNDNCEQKINILNLMLKNTNTISDKNKCIVYNTSDEEDEKFTNK